MVYVQESRSRAENLEIARDSAFARKRFPKLNAARSWCGACALWLTRRLEISEETTVFAKLGVHDTSISDR